MTNSSPNTRIRFDDHPGESLTGNTRSPTFPAWISHRLALPWFVLLSLGCKDPTQVRIHVRTDVPYNTDRMLAFTATSPQNLEEAEPNAIVDHAWGPSGDIGTLVVVPDSDRNAKLAIQVIMGVTRDPSECSREQPDGCIIARRRLQFLEHKTLEMPIGLHAVCEGMPCDESSTCNALGECVPADIDPSKCSSPDASGCMPQGDSLPSGVSVDGGSDAHADGGSDASVEAGDADAGQQTLIAHYRCDPAEKEGDPPLWGDASPAMLHGTCETGRCPGIAPGIRGGACDFDGIDDAVVLPISLAEPFSITFWAQLDDSSQGTMMAQPYGSTLYSWAAWLTSMDDGIGVDHFYEVRSNDGTNDTGHGKAFVCNPCRMTPSICMSCSHTAETWYFGHVKWDGSLLGITFTDDPTTWYNLRSSSSASATLFDDSTASLGAVFRDGNYSSFFDGRLDEIRIHNRVLTEDEIRLIVLEDMGTQTASLPL